MRAVHVQWLDQVPDLVALAQQFPVEFPFLLDSSVAGPLAEHSLLMYADGPRLMLRGPGRLSGPGHGSDFLSRLRTWYLELATGGSESDNGAVGLPFVGGWFLYLGYELAAEIEPKLRLPAQTTGFPDAFAQRCPGAVVVCHRGGPGARPRAAAVAESRAVLDDILGRLAARAPVRQACLPALRALVDEPPERFEQGVRRVLQYLAAGDVFQVNISRAFRGAFAVPPDPVELYRRLQTANPAPFAGLLRFGRHTLLSSSPERLVQVRGSRIQTRPIAGTRPRGKGRESDAALSRELIENLKERAEHIMLIDLERNDLGRVCRPGSVEVSELMVVESYAHVHHIVSNVRGQLQQSATPIDAIAAVFPGGTITGCPKVRCMEIIAELEMQGRGFYTGSMGYLGRDGSLDLNILIRSMLLEEDRFQFRTGAGIVADSLPERELQETVDKARGLLLALREEPAEAASA